MGLIESILSNDYISLYFYSAIFQGNMSLIGIAAVFIIFKLQAIDHEIATAFLQIKQRILNYFPHPMMQEKVESKILGIEKGIDLVGELSEWQSTAQPIGDQVGFKKLADALLNDPSFDKLESNEQRLKVKYNTIVEEAIGPLKWAIGICIYSATLLAIAFFIHKNFLWLELALILTTLVFQFVVLRKIFKFALLSLVKK